MNIVVTGSTGFVGRHLVPKLLLTGHQVLETTLEPDVSIKLFGNETKKIEINDNQEKLKESIFKFKPDIVVHLASYLTSLDNYETLQKILNANIIFFTRLLDALKGTNLKVFINTGTCAENYNEDGDSNPSYLYAAAKTASRSFLDYYSNRYNFKQFTVVPYTIYGGDYIQKKIIDIIISSLDSKTPINLSPGDQILDFIHIDDIVDLYISLINNHNSLPNKINIQAGTGKGTSLKQLAKLIEDVSGKKTNINWGGIPYRPTDILYAVANIPKFDFWTPKIELVNGIFNHLEKIKKI